MSRPAVFSSRPCLAHLHCSRFPVLSVKGIRPKRRILTSHHVWAATLLICVALICSSAHAQTVEFTQNSSGANSVTFQVPLANYPGRGASLPVTLTYSSKGVWRVGYINRIYAMVGGVSTARAASEAIYAEFSTAGWTTSLDIPRIEWPKQNDVYWFDGKPYYQTVVPYTRRMPRVFIHMPDGSTHELRKSDQPYQDAGTIDMSGTFYAVDGTRLRYDSTGVSTGTLYLADGSRYILGSSTVQFIDRNGNTLTFNLSNRQWTDTLGRVIGMPWPSNPQATDYTYAVPGVGGSSVYYTLKFRNLSAVLSSGSLVPMANYYLPDPSQPPTSYNGLNFPQPTGGTTLFAGAYADPEQVPLDERSFTYVVGRGQSGSSVFNPVVLSEIVLPNGQSYTFTYNIYGELDKVIYPTGGYQRYQYGSVYTLGQILPPYDQGSRGLSSQWVSANGTGSDEAQWQYAASLSGITQTAPDGTKTETYLHNIVNLDNNAFGHEDARNGLAYEQRVYAPLSQGGAMLRRTLTEYAQSSATYTRSSPGTGTYTAMRNARPIKTVNLILDTGGNALTSASTFGYDTTYQFTVGVDQTSAAEYAFTTVAQSTAQTSPISSIPLGSLLRTTVTGYLTSNSNYRNRNILGVPTSIQVKNAVNTIVAQTTFSYDEAAYPLLQYGSVISWTDPQTTYRGNLTTMSRWLDYPASTWIVTHSQYDQCGSVRITWDGLGRQSQVDYAVTYGYAYPTTTTSAVPDSSGTYGQTSGLVTTSSYDFNTGLSTSSTDPNGRTTGFEYNDSLNRLTRVNHPDGGWTSTSYSDTPGNIYVYTQTLQQTTPSQQVMESYQFFDKLGRASRSFVKEGTTYLTSDTQYDNLGRAWRVSNPYRTTSLSDPINPSNLWTTTSYDALSRPKTITSPDNAQVTTTYGANLTGSYLGTTVTATDQALKARKAVTDAQGRLIQVVEDPNGLAYQTNYTYDVLDNLRKVEQGVQLRYFGYDSLSRVVRVRNVEQAVNSALTWTDPVTGYNGWTMGSTYDNNGNLLSRIDARNTTATFTYDGLNRIKTVRYTNDPQNTSGIDNYYDGYRAGINNSIPNSKGRLWQSETLSQVLVTVDNFDVLGGATIQRQQFWAGGAWSTSYKVQRSFNYAGQITSETYPSGHTVSYQFDQAGRMKTFSGNLGDGASRTYANNYQYNEWSGLQQEQFGTLTPLYHKQRVNVRGQLWDMRLSTVPYNTDPANGDRGALVNYYSNNFVQGGSGTDNNGNVLRQEIYIPGSNFFQQTFNYDDPLNRLKFVNEKLNGTGSDSFKQAYIYDRYGNRTVDQIQTTSNVPRPNYTVDTSTNRLTAPAGYTYGYDSAGNQNNDNYTGGGQRTFDAENRMNSAWSGGFWQYYKYSGGGLRVRRIVNNVEVWQVYGFSGELLAEYAAQAATFIPQKEYGYRGGQVLVTAANGDEQRLTNFVQNFYFRTWLYVPSQSEVQTKVNALVAAGQQGQTQLLTEAQNQGTQFFTSSQYTSRNRTDSEFVSDLYLAYLQRPGDPGGLSYWTSQVPIQGRTAVRNAIAASGEFVWIVDALWGAMPGDYDRTDRFLNHVFPSALNRFPSAAEQTSERSRFDTAGASGYDATVSAGKDLGRWLFLGSEYAARARTDHWFVYDLYQTLLRYDPDAGGWSYWEQQVAIQGRPAILESFMATSTYQQQAGSLYREVFWLTTDHLGTPRMIAERTGSLPGIKRHDYLPFGEELGWIGGRGSPQGYVGDTLRQKFTQNERDGETGLDYARARYDASAQGRFISVDPLLASADIADPQSLNRYSYVNNDPLNQTDPSGLMPMSDATTAWSDVADGFWGSSFNFGAPARQNHIGAAMARHDSLIDTGYDPGFGFYPGEVQVEYETADYSVTRTLNNPTQEELDQTMDSMANNSSSAQVRGGPRRSGGARASSPRSDPRNWRWIPNRRGGSYRYVGPRTWSEGLRHVGGTWRVGSGSAPPLRGEGLNRHHIFPRQFKTKFRDEFGINIDSATLLMSESMHRNIHPQWNRDWSTFFANNPRATRGDVFRFAVDMMFRYNIHLYSAGPYR